MDLLKGTIYITDNLEYIYNTPLDGSTKIISLDEDDVLKEGNHIIGGTCLLPPMEAKIAEADGNEFLYDNAYRNHLLLPYQQQFISALISFLYKGGNLLLFLPELGYTNTTEKLIQHLYMNYGIHPGLIGNPNPVIANCYYDARCIPMWLNLMYTANVLSPFDFLYLLPEDAQISSNEIMNKLIFEIKPYGKTLNDRIGYILRFHKIIHKNRFVIPAIESMEV